MCEAVVVLDEREIMRDVVRLESLPGGVRVTVLLGQPRTIMAIIREIDFLQHRVVLTSAEAVAQTP